MFNLTVELLINKTCKNPINIKCLHEYLEYLCKKFTDEVIDDYEFGLDNKRCFKMDCVLYKSKVVWNINCDSYEKTLKIVQKIFRLNAIEFQGYELRVISLNMKEIKEQYNYTDLYNFA